jgi:hypothetical protein
MTSGRITVIIVAVALASIVAVVVASGGGDDEAPEPRPQVPGPRPQEDSPDRTLKTPEKVELSDNPDDVRGSDSFSLIHAGNFRRALGVLERRRQKVEGVFDTFRLAPGRIDTVILHPDDRRTNIQIRPDLKLSSDFTHDFPTQADFRKGGLSARDIDVTAPEKLLREFDQRRSGSAVADVDYCVIDRDIIDFKVNISCYMRIRTPRPRSFLKEAGEPLRVIG